ncbi:MAG: metallophosphoesterase, partial [Gammaproteobacteria bacterium]
DEHAASDPYALAEIAKNDLGMRIPGRYYSEKFENNQMVVHILALDTSTVAIDATQQKWATAQALQHQENKNNESRDSKKHWLVVFTHHPPFSYGEHGLQGENHYLLPLLQTVYEQADLLVCGHEHDAQYLQAKPRVKNASASKNKSMQHPTANPDSIDLDDHQLPPTLIVGTSCESRTVKSGPYSAFHSLQPAFGRIVITGDTITSEIVGAPSADRTDRTLLFAETIRDASRSRQTENTTPV